MRGARRLLAAYSKNALSLKRASIPLRQRKIEEKGFVPSIYIYFIYIYIYIHINCTNLFLSPFVWRECINILFIIATKSVGMNAIRFLALIHEQFHRDSIAAPRRHTRSSCTSTRAFKQNAHIVPCRLERCDEVPDEVPSCILCTLPMNIEVTR